MTTKIVCKDRDGLHAILAYIVAKSTPCYISTSGEITIDSWYARRIVTAFIKACDIDADVIITEERKAS